MNTKKQAATRPERSFAGSAIEIKKMADGAAPDGSFSGYGATFNELHGTSAWWLGADWQDIIKPGAFTRTLADHKKRGSKPAMFFDHTMVCPIGVWDRIEEDKKGLATDGRLCLDVQDIADKYALMRMGAIPAESIGFMPVEYELDEKSKVRTLTDVDLIEVSVVTLPGNPGAQISDVKSGAMKFDPTNIREIEAALRDVGFSATEAKRLLAGGFKALAQRDAEDETALQEAISKLTRTIRGQ